MDRWCPECERSIGRRGVRRRGKVFCSRRCAYEHYLPFCRRCIAETTSESTGNLSRTNGSGSTLFAVGGEWPCPHCGAEVMRVWFTFFWVPLIPYSRYLVLWVETPGFFRTGRFLSRRLRE